MNAIRFLCRCLSRFSPCELGSYPHTALLGQLSLTQFCATVSDEQLDRELREARRHRRSAREDGVLLPKVSAAAALCGPHGSCGEQSCCPGFQGMGCDFSEVWLIPYDAWSRVERLGLSQSGCSAILDVLGTAAPAGEDSRASSETGSGCCAWLAA